VLADGRQAVSASVDRTLRLWDLETGAELRRFGGHGKQVTAVAVLADGRQAVSASVDRTLRLWDLDGGAELRRFEAHQGWVRAVAVLADGQRALSGSADRTLRLWAVDTGDTLATLHLDAAVTCLAVADHDRVVVGDVLGRLHWIAIKPSKLS
jgi:WD40 repeat protein